MMLKNNFARMKDYLVHLKNTNHLAKKYKLIYEYLPNTLIIFPLPFLLAMIKTNSIDTQLYLASTLLLTLLSVMITIIQIEKLIKKTNDRFIHNINHNDTLYQLNLIYLLNEPLNDIASINVFLKSVEEKKSTWKFLNYLYQILDCHLSEVEKNEYIDSFITSNEKLIDLPINELEEKLKNKIKEALKIDDKDDAIHKFVKELQKNSQKLSLSL
jgi:hypothetical protein